MINQSYDNYWYQGPGSIEDKILIFVTTPGREGGAGLNRRPAEGMEDYKPELNGDTSRVFRGDEEGGGHNGEVVH